MADRSPIEWTDATWNPTVGCSVVSPGCTNCYAMRLAARLEKMLPPERHGDAVLPNHYSALTKPSKAGPVWTGRLSLAPGHIITKPLQTRKPTTWFVNSMSDLFHDAVSDAWVADIFGVMAVASNAFHREQDGFKVRGSYSTSDGREVSLKWPNQKSGPHTFQVLTKRSDRMRRLLNSGQFRREVAGAAYRHAHNRTAAGVLSDEIEFGSRWPLPNVWLGVSAEDQRRADERVPDLLATPAAVRFVSAEPLLGPIDFQAIQDADAGATEPWPHMLDALTGEVSDEANGPVPIHEPGKAPRINQIIVGGESGRGARVWPGFEDAARSIQSQCVAAGVAFFMKQMAGVSKRAMPPIPADLAVRQLPGAAA